MKEKRFTLRMSNAVFELAKSIAENNNRSIAKEIEYSLARYYLLLPLIDRIYEDYQFNIQDLNENQDIRETRELIINELEQIKANYELFSRNNK